MSIFFEQYFSKSVCNTNVITIFVFIACTAEYLQVFSMRFLVSLSLCYQRTGLVLTIKNALLMKTKVLALLKPKVVALGFTTEELEGVAADLAGNLKDDATDEQINLVVNSAIPSLKLSQQAVNRIVNADKEKAKTQQEKEAKEKADKEEVEKKAKGGSNEDEKVPTWAQSLIDQNKVLGDQVKELSGARTLETRLSQFESIVKDLPEKQKASFISDFKRISFTDDTDFNSYLEEKKALVPELVQEQANDKLGKMGRPGGGGSSVGGKEASKEEVDSVVDKLPI